MSAEQSGLVPHLVVNDGAGAIDFYTRAFGAELLFQFPKPDGGLMHAEMMINGARIMLADEMGECKSAPTSLGGSTVTINLNVPDADAAIAKAEAAGGTVSMPAADMFWGDRYGRVIDPFGHHWAFATHQRDVSMEEIKSGAAKMFAADD